MMKREYKFVILIVICVVAAGEIFLLVNTNEITGNSTIGSDNKGYVTKEVYGSTNTHPVKIAVITGIHPRENLAIGPVKTVIKNYTSSHNVEITNYAINVQDHPEDYTIGRNNGEYLAAQYIVPDIKKSHYNLVIICHAHQLGYGSGFFIATPRMDAKSVQLAQTVQEGLPQLNYLKGVKNSKPQTTSAIRVSNPIADTGTPVFVYEIPEWVGVNEASNMTYKLLDVSFNVITNVK